MREGQKVWIEGVKGFSPGEYADSVHGCQARILEALGEPLTYDELVCCSGFAFRIGVHEQMCPSAGHPCCGYMCLDNAFRAMPWKMKPYESFPWGAPKDDRAAFEAEVCAAVAASIDRGIPVHHGGEEDGLIIGCADGGRRWWCVHPYHKWGAEPFWHDKAKGSAGGNWPWVVVVWQGPKPAGERVPDRDLTVAALRLAVDMWKTQKREAYFCGDAAYGHWLDWLRGVDAGTVEDPKAGMQGNGWCFDVLVHSRRIAARWLERKAPVLGGPARGPLGVAAGRYGQTADACMKDLECPWGLAVGPGKFDQWTGAMRRDQIERLEAAREHDRAAIAAIEQALEALR